MTNEEFIEQCLEEWTDENQDDLRYEFEQHLIENDYSPSVVSEVDDGWDERCRDEFYEHFFGKKYRACKLTEEEQANKLREFFNF